MSVIPADAYLTRACVNTDAHPGVWASGLRNPRALVTTGRRTRSFVDRRRRGGGWREEWRATPEFLQRPWPRPSLCVRPHTRASAPSWREEGVGGRAWRVWRYVAVNCLGSAVMTRVLPPQTRSIATDGEEREGLSLDRFRDREKPTARLLSLELYVLEYTFCYKSLSPSSGRGVQQGKLAYPYIDLKQNMFIWLHVVFFLFARYIFKNF